MKKQISIMQKIIACFLGIMLSFAFFIACKKAVEKPPTNEELITERIECFVTAYNDGDMDTVLLCLDAKKRNVMQAWMNLAGALAGHFAGFQINLSDLFSLGIGMKEGDFMELEMGDIKILDTENAVATTNMDLPMGEAEVIYFIMVYEKDGWYISNMTDNNPIKE